MFLFFATVLTLALVIRFLLILVLCLVTAYLADALSVFFLPSTCVSTFRMTSGTFFSAGNVLPIMLLLFATVLTLTLFPCALLITMAYLNTTDLADTLSFFIFPVVST